MNFRSKDWIIIGCILCLLFMMGCEKKTNKLACTENKIILKLVEIAQSDYQWTGVAVSKEGRIFVNFPRWSESIPFSVGEVFESGEIQPYPDKIWNDWNPEAPADKQFVCIQSVYIDHDNYLWILDPASPFLQGVIEKGPKLFKVDLQTSQIIKTFHFEQSVAPNKSYLNDIRVEKNTGHAYITDSGEGAIIVLNLKTGISRRVLDDHKSTTAEDITLKIAGNEINIKVHSDGIALDSKQEYLYYQSLTGHHLYRIKTEHLRDSSLMDTELEDHVELVGESGASDGLLYKEGYIYLTSIEHSAIRRISTKGILETLIQDPKLEWPDSFSLSPDGTIYVTTSKIGFPPDSGPYRLFQLK